MRIFTSLLFCFALVASGSSQLTVLELLAAAPSNSHFNDIVSNDDLNALLDSETDLTVLVPNNDAIDAYAAAMGMTTADFIASESAVDMALYHIVPNEAIMFSALSGESVVTTALGMPISFQEYEVVNATDVAADLEASNGWFICWMRWWSYLMEFTSGSTPARSTTTSPLR